VGSAWQLVVHVADVLPLNVGAVSTALAAYPLASPPTPAIGPFGAIGIYPGTRFVTMEQAAPVA